MKITAKIAFVLAFALCLAAAPARAGNFDDRKGAFAAQYGIGLDIIDGDAGFSMAFEGEYFFHQNVSIVPRLSLDLHDGVTIFTITGDARYTFDLREPRFQPFVEMGAGVAIGDPDGGDSEAAFQFEFGGGANYYFTDNFAAGSEMLFTFPIDLFDENFAWQWQVVTVRYIF
ncbi:MAG: outer membrane beta-barrel protein [Bdellovibrionota bacterium]